MADGLTDGRCLTDIKTKFTIENFIQWLNVWDVIRLIQLAPSQEDCWSWRLESSGRFTSKSAYRAFFQGVPLCASANAIWKTWDPLRCKIFIWLVIRKRIWTADRLARRGLPHNVECVLCGNSPEDTDHLLVGCAVSCILRSKVLDWIGHPMISPSTSNTSEEWWTYSRNGVRHGEQKKLNTMVVLVAWSQW